MIPKLTFKFGSGGTASSISVCRSNTPKVAPPAEPVKLWVFIVTKTLEKITEEKNLNYPLKNLLRDNFGQEHLSDLNFHCHLNW